MANNPANFVTDYSNLAAAGSAFNSFAEAYKSAQDDQVKRQETKAKIAAMNAQMDRDATDTALKARTQGLQVGASPTDLQPAAMTPREKAQEGLKAFGEGAQPKLGPDGQPTGDFEINPNSPKAIAAKGMANQRQIGNNFKEESLDLRKDVVDRREHERVLTRINANPNIKTRLQQYQNLDNTLSNITNADHITPEMFDEAQQAVRANLGIKGSSGVGERENTQMKAMGLNADRMKEFLTMSPADIGKDNQLLAHIQNLARLEKQNISGQFDKSLEAASSGHKSMYARRPDLKDDLKDAINAQSSQLSSPQTQEQSPPPQGLVPQKQGFLGKLSGLVGGGGAPAQTNTPSQSFAPDVVKYASEHGITNEQAQAIKIKRTGGQ